MSVLELNQDNFQSTVQSNDIVIVDFWASWCGPCMNFAPVFEAASQKHTDVTFAKVNTEEQKALSAAFNVKSIPLIMIFRENILLYAEPGALPEQMLEELLTQVKNIDMDEVRAKISEQNPE